MPEPFPWCVRVHLCVTILVLVVMQAHVIQWITLHMTHSSHTAFDYWPKETSSMTHRIVTVFSSSDPLQTHKICLIVNIILQVLLACLRALQKGPSWNQIRAHLEKMWIFFEMSYYGEWQIEDEYEIRRIQTSVLRDRNSRLPLKDLVWVEEASIIFRLWRRKAIHGWKHSFW
jgi:hypothetical protein